MDNRTDQSQVSDQLMATLISCRDDLAGLKQRQLVSGDSGVLYYPTENPVAWDYQETLTNINARVRVTFVGDGTQDFPIVQSASEIAVQFGSGPITPLPSDFTIVSSGSNQVTVVHDLETTAASDASGRSTWENRLRVTGTAKLFLKAHIFGSSTGTVLVERTQ